MISVLHIANWYPNPWDTVEGNFVRDQIKVFAQEVPARVVVVQVRSVGGIWPRLRRLALDGGARGYFLQAPVQPGRVTEWLTALLLVGVLLRERAWRFDALHFHIAYPLLMLSGLWRWWVRKPILISEHWSAYHYNFHLPEHSRALQRMRQPFRHCKAVFAVSGALLSDIRAFAPSANFQGHVLPNVVPLHGATYANRPVPVLFTVNRWAPIKNPMPMLAGLNEAALTGLDFKLVIGGFGTMIEAMKAFVETSALRDRTTFTGKMTKPQIAEQLAHTDGYLFSSNYETFSVACAEALGAGVPLIGPYIEAIAEYAGPQDWVQVPVRSAEGWCSAVCSFLMTDSSEGWNRSVIAERVATLFSETSLRQGYRQVMETLKLLSTS